MNAALLSYSLGPHLAPVRIMGIRGLVLPSLIVPGALLPIHNAMAEKLRIE